jgi:hypothetical protein
VRLNFVPNLPSRAPRPSRVTAGTDEAACLRVFELALPSAGDHVAQLADGVVDHGVGGLGGGCAEQGFGGDGSGSGAGIEDALARDGAGELDAGDDSAVDDVDVSVHRVAASLEHHLKDFGDGGVEAVRHIGVRGGVLGCEHVSSFWVEFWV